MESWPDFRPTRLLRRLVEGGVDFVVVGGVAVVVQGYPRFTKDVDICYSAAPENLQALGSVLVAVGARLRGIDEDAPFAPDARNLRQAQILALDSREGPIDLLVDPPGAPSFERLKERADLTDVDGVQVSIASIDDLLAMKRAAGRPQDLLDVEALEVARRRRGRRRR